jgi:hypothetical protein
MSRLRQGGVKFFEHIFHELELIIRESYRYRERNVVFTVEVEIVDEPSDSSLPKASLSRVRRYILSRRLFEQRFSPEDHFECRQDIRFARVVKAVKNANRKHSFDLNILETAISGDCKRRNVHLTAPARELRKSS